MVAEPSGGPGPSSWARRLAAKIWRTAIGSSTEEKLDAVLRVADRVALIENGRILYQATPAELSAAPETLLRHVGVRR